MASKVGIVNIGLIKVGAETITSFTEDKKEARIASAIYDDLRKAVLRSHPWNFAKTRAALAEVAATPAFGWGHQFQLPADCLRALYLDDGAGDVLDAAWEIEGRRLLTDEGTANLVYIRDVTNTGDFDSMFVQQLAALIASDAGFNLHENTSLTERVMKNFESWTRIGRTVDAQEGNKQTVLRAETWLNARR